MRAIPFVRFVPIAEVRDRLPRAPARIARLIPTLRVTTFAALFHEEQLLA
jgi:hypothetical protein